MDQKYIEAERRLAELLGWTNLVEVGGSLVGTPPEGGVRGQAAVPRWARDKAAAFDLIVHCTLLVDVATICKQTWATSEGFTSFVESWDNHPSVEQATMFAIVKAAIAGEQTKLEASKEVANEDV